MRKQQSRTQESYFSCKKFCGFTFFVYFCIGVGGEIPHRDA